MSSVPVKENLSYFLFTLPRKIFEEKTCQGELASVYSQQVFLDRGTCQGLPELQLWSKYYYFAVRRERDLLNNLTIKKCDKVESLKNLKNIQNHLGLKVSNGDYVSLNVIIKSKMSKMRTNINVKEFLGDTNKTRKYVVIVTKYSHYYP